MNVKDAIELRYSTRYLDPVKKISDQDINTIIDAARRAPNGLALEAWKFYVIDGNKEELAKAAYNQKHVLDSSHVIALVAYKDHYIQNNPELITERLDMMGLDEEKKLQYKDRIFNHMNINEYANSQNHIAAGYIALQATELGIGSVIAGGIDRDAIANVLGLNTDDLGVTLLVSLGYSLDEKPKKRKNRDINTVVQKVTL